MMISKDEALLLYQQLVEDNKKIEEAYKAEISLHEFTKQAWKVIKGETFVDGWHIGAICEHVEALFRRQILRLIINVPPRMSKSTVVSVMLPAWAWIHKPEEQFLYASHLRDLAFGHSLLCRHLIASDWYQDRWGDKFNLLSDQNTKGKFSNDKNGHRTAVSVNSKISGFDASFGIKDDINDRNIISSKAARDQANEWDSTGFLMRLNNISDSVVLGIQQRYHEEDNTGYTLSNDTSGEYVHLNLPMEYEVSRKCSTIILPYTNGIKWTDPRTKEGELLCPERVDERGLKIIKSQLITEYNIAGQLQQRPAPSEGGIIKKTWFQWYKQPVYPKFEQIIQSWDTAFTDSKKGSYSACTTWGIFNDEHRVPNLMLIGMWRDHVLYPDLRRIAQDLARDYRYDGKTKDFKFGQDFKPDLILIESKASGQSLIPDLRRAGILCVGFNPTKHGDKDGRVQIASTLIEGGRVWIPALGPTYTQLKPFADKFLEECAIFPNGSSRDIVDSMTQVLIRVKQGGYIIHPKDPEEHFERRQPEFIY